MAVDYVFVEWEFLSSISYALTDLSQVLIVRDLIVADSGLF